MADDHDTPANRPIRYYVLLPQAGSQQGQIATSALRLCSICDHCVDSMGGPGRVSICPECYALLERDQIKIDRERVEKAVRDAD